MICSKCGLSIPDGSSLCPSCGASTQAVPPSRKKPGKKQVLLAAGVLLLLAVVLFVAARSAGSAGPATKIVQAAENTFTADSFAANYDFVLPAGQVNGTFWISYEPKHQNLTLYGEGIVKDRYDNYGLTNAFCGSVFSDSEVYNPYSLDDTLYEIAERWGVNYFFESFLETDTFAELCDSEKLAQCVSSFIQKMDDEEWIQRNAGYHVEKNDSSTIYHFSTTKPLQFIYSITPVFADAFPDPIAYDEWATELLDEYQYIVGMNADFGVKGKELEYVSISLSYDDGDGDGVRVATISASFYDIGSKKNNTQLEKARDIYEKTHSD